MTDDQYRPLPNETMKEYSVRTGLPYSVLDWSYWEEKEAKEKENK
jgi:Trm5-related predicted tRNA methylase